MEDEYVMYILINNDLKMGKGKIASQACHSMCNATRILEQQRPRDKGYNKWLKNGQTKIVLRSGYQDMIDIVNQYAVDQFVKRNSNDAWCVFTRDFGRTQITKDSLTSVVFKPVLKQLAPKMLRKMKLL